MATYISFYAIFLSISLATILFFKVNSIETTSFSFTKFFSDQQNLILQGHAFTRNDVLTLTESYLPRSDVGRALYSAPIHIWDSKTGNVADFTTSFTFVIRENSGSRGIAHGLAFFIAPIDTKPGAGDGLLGLFNSEHYDESIQTLAVEFDTFRDAWDPIDRHVGINVNSIRSNRTVPWMLQTGREANVEITFTAATRVLTVRVYYPNSSSFIHDILHLNNIVPEWVRVGLSASNGIDFARHEVLSWSFRSGLSGISGSNQFAAA